MAAKRDPWQPVGNAIYWFAIFAGKAGAKVRKGTPVTREYEQDPEPRWKFCTSCGHSTFWEYHFWIEDGDGDWECTLCGAVW